MTLRIPVIYGSVRAGRQGIKVARFVERQLRGRGHEVTLVDPLQEQLPLLERRFKDFQPGTAPATLQRLAELYRRADAFVIVSGEYNHSVPPALTNLLDYFLDEYFFRPSGIVSYSSGAYAGVRATVQLREMLCTLGMPSIPATFPVPKVQAAASDDGSSHRSVARATLRPIRGGTGVVRRGAQGATRERCSELGRMSRFPQTRPLWVKSVP